MNFKGIFAGLALCLSLSMPAAAATISAGVDAAANSISSNQLLLGKDTGLVLSVGQAFSVSVDPGDTWSIGTNPLRHLGNADGAPVERLYSFFSGSPLEATFSHGTLVGRIGDGAFFKVGTSLVDKVADISGSLFLYLWDVNAADNTGSIIAEITTVAPVPVPATASLLLLSLGAFAGLRKRTRA